MTYIEVILSFSIVLGTILLYLFSRSDIENKQDKINSSKHWSLNNYLYRFRLFTLFIAVLIALIVLIKSLSS